MSKFKMTWVAAGFLAGMLVTACTGIGPAALIIGAAAGVHFYQSTAEAFDKEHPEHAVP